MANPEFMKEYLREAFMDAALDLGRDRKFMEGFLRIFEGEMEAVIAIVQASYLDEAEVKELLEIARLTPQAIKEYKSWSKRATGKAA